MSRRVIHHPLPIDHGERVTVRGTALVARLRQGAPTIYTEVTDGTQLSEVVAVYTGAPIDLEPSFCHIGSVDVHGLVVHYFWTPRWEAAV